MTKMRENNMKGISQRKNSNRFEAYLTLNAGGKRTTRKQFKAHIGTYDTVEEAHRARMRFIDDLK